MRKKDLIIIIVSTLILFIITEVYLYYFFDATSTFKSIFIGILLITILSIGIIFLCKKTHSFSKNNSTIITLISIVSIFIIFKIFMISYLQYNTNYIYDLLNNANSKFPDAKSINELLEIMKISKEEKEYLDNINVPLDFHSSDNIANELTKVTKKTDSTVHGYDGWKIMYFLRNQYIVDFYISGKTYGFENRNYNKFLSNYNLIGRQEAFHLDLFKKAIDDFTFACITLTIYEIVCSFGIYRFIQKEN